MAMRSVILRVQEHFAAITQSIEVLPTFMNWKIVVKESKTT